MKKWHQLAEEQSAVDQQTQEIYQKFRKKISKEFGQLSGEELFKAITKRLDEKSSTTAEEVQESPDYTRDEFDEINPFGDEFRPDAPTPAPSPPPTPTPPPTPPPPYQEFDGDFPPPPPPLMEEPVMPGPSKTKNFNNKKVYQPFWERSISCSRNTEMTPLTE